MMLCGISVVFNPFSAVFGLMSYNPRNASDPLYIATIDYRQDQMQGNGST
jgi:hypothetical protein